MPISRQYSQCTHARLFVPWTYRLVVVVATVGTCALQVALELAESSLEPRVIARVAHTT